MLFGISYNAFSMYHVKIIFLLSERVKLFDSPCPVQPLILEKTFHMALSHQPISLNHQEYVGMDI